ncbi:MAG: hypothetical protein ACR2P8_03375 [Myxococcota bacterium]
MRPPSLAIRIALAGMLGLSCQSPAPGRPSLPPEAENRVFLVLPLNVAATMPDELVHFSPVVRKELELYLRDQEKQLKTISETAARTLWRRMIQRLRAAESSDPVGYEDAARALTLELRKHAEFDAMIAPSLFIQKARINNRSARWDGVEQELEIEGRGLAARSLAWTPIEGSAPAASIHVAAFDAGGNRLHEGQGGLDLLVRVRVQARNPSGVGGADGIRRVTAFEFATRTDLFSNRAQVREGISAAFVPFLPSLPE